MVGVPLGTKAGPLLFVIMMDDITTICPTYKYVDDSTLYEICRGPSTLLQIATEQTAEWSYNNLMNINAVKTKGMLFKFCEKPVVVPLINLSGVDIKRVKSTSYLVELAISEDLIWTLHITDTYGRGAQRHLYLILHEINIQRKIT